MKSFRMLMGIVGMLVLTLSKVQGADESAKPLRVGVTAKADWMNIGFRPGLKILMMDRFAAEAYYVGLGGDYTGYTVRGMYLFPALWEQESIRLRPYAGLGFSSVEQEIEYGGSANYNYSGYQAGYTARAKYTYEGSWPVVFAGVQINPIKTVPNLVFEAELLYSIFDVELDAEASARGTGAISGAAAHGSAHAESDYDELGLVLGISYYF